MSHTPVAGYVLYSLDPQALGAFYARLLGWPANSTQDDYVQLQHQGFELTLVQVPPAIAASITVQSPALPRSNSAFKPVFFIPDLAQARILAGQMGAVVRPVASEWTFNGTRVCDGVDPEGNIFQLRQITAD